MAKIQTYTVPAWDTNGIYSGSYFLYYTASGYDYEREFKVFITGSEQTIYEDFNLQPIINDDSVVVGATIFFSSLVSASLNAEIRTEPLAISASTLFVGNGDELFIDANEISYNSTTTIDFADNTIDMTASVANTASYINLAESASYATTASYINLAKSASYAATCSYVIKDTANFISSNYTASYSDNFILVDTSNSDVYILLQNLPDQQLYIKNATGSNLLTVSGNIDYSAGITLPETSSIILKNYNNIWYTF